MGMGMGMEWNMRKWMYVRNVYLSYPKSEAEHDDSLCLIECETASADEMFGVLPTKEGFEKFTALS